MEFIKQIFCHNSNQIMLYSLLEEHLKEKLNIDIKNIPNVMTLLREHMYGVYKKYTLTLDLELIQLNNKEQINEFVKELNTLTLKSFLKEYIEKHYLPYTFNNSSSHSHLKNKNFSSNCVPIEDIESQTIQPTNFQQQQHNDEIFSRCLNKDAYFESRRTATALAFEGQEYDPKKLMLHLQNDTNNSGICTNTRTNTDPYQNTQTHTGTRTNTNTNTNTNIYSNMYTR
jgi:hypothetical protein